MIRRAAAVAAAAAIIVVAGVAYLVVRGVYLPAGADSIEPVLFSVARGESFGAVRRRLVEAGLIEYPKTVSAYATLTRTDRRIRAGVYRIAPGDTPRSILRKFVAGDIFRVPVTIPEGFMYMQIAGVLAEQAAVDSVEFAELFDDPEVLAELGVDGPNLEGYLFPDTYSVPFEWEARRVAATMTRRLDAVFAGGMEKRAKTIGLSRHEVLTLASIIEAETRLPEERPVVSAVYHNRLRRHMRLEADPTVAYAMGGYRGRLFFKDLEIDSPYNTYKYAGLPPGPICSPGRAAIHAALYPDSTSKALYFVARGNGSHVFSATLRDHLAAVRRVRRERRAAQH